MKFLRVTGWPEADDTEAMHGQPFTAVVAEDDVKIPVENYVEWMHAQLGGVVFFTADIFEYDGDLEAAVLEAGKRTNPEVESNQAVAYHWNGSMLQHAKVMLANSGPTPLDVEQTTWVAKQLKGHPNYKGQTIQFYIWNDDPDDVKILVMNDDDIRLLEDDS